MRRRTLPVALSAVAASPCFRRSRSRTCIRGRWSRRRADRWSAWSTLPIRISNVIRASATPWRRRRPRCWNQAMRFSSLTCGGTTCRGWSRSTCWSTTGGTSPAYLRTPHARALPCAFGRCAIGPNAKNRPGERCSTTTCSAMRSAPANTLPPAGAQHAGTDRRNMGAAMRAMLINKLNR